MQMNQGLMFTSYVNRRVDEVQQELQVAMDELSQARDQARELHPA